MIKHLLKMRNTTKDLLKNFDDENKLEALESTRNLISSINDAIVEAAIAEFGEQTEAECEIWSYEETTEESSTISVNAKMVESKLEDLIKVETVGDFIFEEDPDEERGVKIHCSFKFYVCDLEVWDNQRITAQYDIDNEVWEDLEWIKLHD